MRSQCFVLILLLLSQKRLKLNYYFIERRIEQKNFCISEIISYTVF